MSTVIYPSPVFGPIHSRRLGVSLGINLLPADGKFCTFDCIYCECGYNKDHRPHQKLPTREEVRETLENRLKDMQINGQFKIHNYRHFMQILPYVAPVRVEQTAAKAWKIAKK